MTDYLIDPNHERSVRVLGGWIQDEIREYNHRLIRHTIDLYKLSKAQADFDNGKCRGLNSPQSTLDCARIEIQNLEEEITEGFAFLNTHLDFDTQGEA